MPRFLGYDPGGDNAHGVATLDVSVGGAVIAATSALVATGEEARRYFAAALFGGDVAGIGVDTLTEWCLDSAGWRPADTWLRTTYRSVRNSVMTPNRLSGSMCLNGIGVVHRLLAAHPELVVSETHPKVLYFALAGSKYDWTSSASSMCTWLHAQTGGTPAALATEHEFDALISAWACMQGVTGCWSRDLHAVSAAGAPATIVRPVGRTRYFWP